MYLYEFNAVHACNTCRRRLSPLLMPYHVSMFQLNPHQNNLKSEPCLLPAGKLRAAGHGHEG